MRRAAVRTGDLLLRDLVGEGRPFALVAKTDELIAGGIFAVDAVEQGHGGSSEMGWENGERDRFRAAASSATECAASINSRRFRWACPAL